eukprot:scaffold3899_cov393-Prasinococcus_capsulatus_cf.AAC.2
MPDAIACQAALKSIISVKICRACSCLPSGRVIAATMSRAAVSYGLVSRTKSLSSTMRLRSITPSTTEQNTIVLRKYQIKCALPCPH